MDAESEAVNGGQDCAAEPHPNDSPVARPAARAAAPGARHDGSQNTKHSVSGVLHDFVLHNEDFRRV
jgi:hypothetical protein